MAQLQDFTPEQISEAAEWYRENNYSLWEQASSETIPQLTDVYFKLKMISIELRPNQFVIGVDYVGVTKKEYIEKGQNADLSKLKVNLSFWNPHPRGVADILAKDILVAQLAKL